MAEFEPVETNLNNNQLVKKSKIIQANYNQIRSSQTGEQNEPK